MQHSIDVNIQAIELTLFARRAAYCRAHSTLFVADTHFGKEATFRRSGIPVPRGSTDGTLTTIRKLLAETAAEHLVILGDMFHAPSSLSTDVVRSLEKFFCEHNSINFTLIRGNHDTRVGQLPSSWPIQVREAGERLGKIALGHHPATVPENADLLFCGHLHPAVRLRDKSASVGKLPCFWLSKGCLVFPAIGEFTGTHVVRATGHDRTWIIAGDEIC